MSTDLDNLAEIADAMAFGTSPVAPNGERKRGKFPTEFCGEGHLWADETTRWYRYRGRLRRLCRICDKTRRKGPKCSPIR